MLGNNIKMIRKEKGLSQEELAARLHVVRQTVSKWEKSVSVPDADLLARISEILDTPVSTLLGSSVEQASDSTVISQQLEQINATLAEKNRRSKLIWKIVGIVLLVILVINLLLVIVGVISFDNYKSDTNINTEEIFDTPVENGTFVPQQD